jgi:hypothetical protein
VTVGDSLSLVEWVYLVFPGFMLARGAFAPRGVFGPEPPDVAALNRIRAVVGLLTALGIWAVYGSRGPMEAVVNTVVLYVVAAVLVVPLYLLIMIVMVLASRDRRAQWSTMLRGPLVSMVALPLLLGAFYLVTKLGFTPDAAKRQNPLVALVMFYFGIQLALCAFAIPYYAWVHGYRAVDGNPLLRPLVTPVLAWTGVALGQLFGDFFTDAGVPGPLAVATSIGGAVVMTLLAVWEYRSVAHHYGITFRSGPPPVLLRPQEGSG